MIGCQASDDPNELFQYIDEAGSQRTIDSYDVNEHIREITVEDITAKDIRTWAATNLRFSRSTSPTSVSSGSL